MSREERLRSMKRPPVKEERSRGRVVASKRFSLPAGAPSRVLSESQAEGGSDQPTKRLSGRLKTVETSRVITDGQLRQLRHPVLWSITDDESEDKEALPVIDDKDGGPLYTDRWDDQLRWCMPDFRLNVGAGDDDAPALIVRETGQVGADGEKEYEGELVFVFTDYQSDALKESVHEAENNGLTVRDIPVSLREVELVLSYREDNEDQSESYITDYDPELGGARFQLRGNALKLAFALVSSSDRGVEVCLNGDYNAWETVGDSSSENISDEVSIPTRKAPAIGLNRISERADQRLQQQRKLRINQRRLRPFAKENGKPSYARQRMVFQRSYNAALPCNEAPHRYQIETGDDFHHFGCEPPWQSGYQPGARYRKLATSVDLDLPESLSSRIRVYESLHEARRFVVFPESYVLARTVDDASPALSMTTILDPMEADNNTVIFDAAVAPNLLTCELALLRNALFKFLSPSFDIESPGMQDDQPLPKVVFPTAAATRPTLEWNDAFTELTSFILDGDAILLQTQAKSMGKASAVVTRLRPDSDAIGALTGTIKFELDDEHREEVAAVVSLGRTTGEVLKINLIESEGGAQAELVNETDSTVYIPMLICLRAGGRVANIEHMADGGLTLAAGNSVQLPVPDGTEEVLAEQQVEVSESDSLTEMRVDVDTMTINLAIESDLQAHETFTANDEEQAVKAIRVELRRLDGGNERHTLKPFEDGLEPRIADLVVPLDHYLAPDLRQLDYRATFVLNKGTELRSDWRTHNFSDTRLTIRRTLLKDLLDN